ncbi:hypothetical protein KAW50_03675 [candidate division WOR-3 bacterium]|nr:hypothetical protein [candidate division WOR-3 bacterium]
MNNSNSKSNKDRDQNRKIEKLEADVSDLKAFRAEEKAERQWIKNELGVIRHQVFNGIPHSLKEIENKMVKKIENTDKKIEGIKSKLLWGFMAVIVTAIVSSLLTKLL